MYIAKRRRLQPIIILLIAASVFLVACGAEVADQNWPGLAVNDGIVYAAYGPGVAAVDIQEQSLLWRFPDEVNPGLLFFASPSINDERIVFGDYGAPGGMFAPQSTVTIYSLENGAAVNAPSILWARDDVALDRVVASATQADDQIFVGTADNRLYALDASDGSVQWEFETAHSIWAQPLYNEGIVFIASLDNSVYALSADNGDLLWQTELSGSVASSPVLQDGLLYVPSFDRVLHALDAETGQEQWSADAENWIWGSPEIGNGTVYYADINGNIYAAGATSGEQRWRYSIDGAIQSKPLYVDGMLFVTAGEIEGDEDERIGQILALDVEAGTEIWRRETSAPVFTGPVAVDDSVVIVFQQGGATILQVYTRENGALVWDLTLPAD
ncbi:MAG TPA: PQQ-binding-like beta-propeller repeat protein [Candidatus Sulfomarinibacteraceae bacterium]|nr:PQQ-binding-like beta-propeller repeat protein [Candidatus Sulfomarinibacteraceae bacterium]